jgi:hypothetical protein
MAWRHAAEDEVRTRVGLVEAFVGNDSGGMEAVGRDAFAVTEESDLEYQRWHH